MSNTWCVGNCCAAQQTCQSLSFNARKKYICACDCNCDNPHTYSSTIPAGAAEHWHRHMPYFVLVPVAADCCWTLPAHLKWSSVLPLKRARCSAGFCVPFCFLPPSLAAAPGPCTTGRNRNQKNLSVHPRDELTSSTCFSRHVSRTAQQPYRECTLKLQASRSCLPSIHRTFTKTDQQEGPTCLMMTEHTTQAARAEAQHLLHLHPILPSCRSSSSSSPVNSSTNFSLPCSMDVSAMTNDAVPTCHHDSTHC